MELSSLLHDLHLSTSEKPLPSLPLPPITELLSRLREKLIGSSDSETSSLIGRVERLFQTADPDWLFSPALANEEEGWAGLVSAYRSLVEAVIGCAAVPLCEDDVVPVAAYQSVPGHAVPACTALTALLVAIGNLERRDLLLAVAPPLCVLAVTHFQVSEVCRCSVQCLSPWKHLDVHLSLRTNRGQAPPPGRRHGACRRSC